MGTYWQQCLSGWMEVCTWKKQHCGAGRNWCVHHDSVVITYKASTMSRKTREYMLYMDTDNCMTPEIQEFTQDKKDSINIWQ